MWFITFQYGSMKENVYSEMHPLEWLKHARKIYPNPVILFYKHETNEDLFEVMI